MQNGNPSITAQRVALRRAAHQVLDNPLVFDDPYALTIIGAEAASNLRSAPAKLFDPGSKYIRAFMAARSRYAEDQLAAAMKCGVKQYVILGAGLDTFGYRNQYPAAELSVIEVDHPATQAWKREILLTEGIAIPSNVAFAPVDFEKQTLAEGLRAAGCETRHQTFFSWMGVTPYLTSDAFSAVLLFIAGMPPGSGVAFDYAVSRASLNPIERTALDALSSRVASAGEPFQLFFEQTQLALQLGGLGFRDVEDLGSKQINDRYFSGRSDGLHVIGGLARLVSAYL